MMLNLVLTDLREQKGGNTLQDDRRNNGLGEIETYLLLYAQHTQHHMEIVNQQGLVQDRPTICPLANPNLANRFEEVLVAICGFLKHPADP